LPALDGAHEVTDSIDVIGDDIRQFEARDLILNRDYQFQAIEPVRPEVVVKARLVRDAPRYDAKCPAIISRTFRLIFWCMIATVLSGENESARRNDRNKDFAAHNL
jgi:hypothetical protein